MNRPATNLRALLVAYFYSGWAFFIPYLLVYLLYDWLEWPTTPEVNALSSPFLASTTLATNVKLPYLLHVFWFIHLIHLFLIGVAALTPHRISRLAGGFSLSPGGLLPWACLGLLFLIPGIYLEWPTDPWEHLQRITEWDVHPIAGDHSAGYKSLYFLPYSIIGGEIHAWSLTMLNLYSTSLCLLLAWQYYRLGLAVRLSPQSGFLFALLVTVAMGSSCFAFSRYYNLSTSVFAQIGALGLTRQSIILISLDKIFFTQLIRATLKCLLLIALISANHVQGLGIVALNISSVVAWRICRAPNQRRWLAIGTFALLNLAVFFLLPRHELVNGDFKSMGWLSQIFGFNIFSWHSPASDRAVMIIGGMGVASLIVALVHLCQNKLVGWLTWGPVLWLSLPAFALPFANLLAESGKEQIVTFHRMFFALPIGLSIAWWFDSSRGKWSSSSKLRQEISFAALLLLLWAIVATNPGRPSYNRFWNLVAVAPADLQLKPLGGIIDSLRVSVGDPLNLPIFSGALRAITPLYMPNKERPIGQPVAGEIENIIKLLESQPATAQGQFEELVEDPMMHSPDAWTNYSGTQSNFGVDTFASVRGSRALQNPEGETTEVLNARPIKLRENTNYQIEISIRQVAGKSSLSIPMVAWIGRTGEVLPSFSIEPAGWENGTYSYFGRFAPHGPSAWTTFRTSFGPAERRAIPVEAQAFQIGALLNTDRDPSALVQLANVRAWIKKPSTRIVNGIYSSNRPYNALRPNWRWLYTPLSQAATLSKHWPRSQVASDLAGGQEIDEAVETSKQHNLPNITQQLP